MCISSTISEHSLRILSSCVEAIGALHIGKKWLTTRSSERSLHSRFQRSFLFNTRRMYKILYSFFINYFTNRKLGAHLIYVLVNPYLTNEFSHHYNLCESTSIFRGVRYDEISSLRKQNSPRWDAAFCGVTSGAILFAYVP